MEYRYNQKYDVLIDENGVIYDTNYKKIQTYHNVSNSGRSYPCFNHNGYRRVFCHRAVAYSWCKGYAKEKVVDHIDNNPDNYNPNNLRWVTKSENLLYYHREQKLR